MSLLNVSDLSFRYFSGSLLFEGATFSVDPGDRIAVVGPNGCGKSTLLRILSGDLEPTRGEIVRRQQLKIGVAEQVVTAAPGATLFDLVFGGDPVLAAMRARILLLEHQLGDTARAAEYADAIHEYEEMSGFLAEAEAARNLGGLGFRTADFERPIEQLSGGERTRAALARALSTAADLLILDEPTNHLDVTAREWLEQSLAARQGACIVTSHDRALLRAFARRVVEIHRGRVRVFEGGYDDYRAARALLDEQAWASYDAFERRKRAAESAARKRDQVARRVATTPVGIRGGKDHYARKAAKVQRTARILRERVSEEKRVEKPWEEQPIDGLTFEPAARSGDVVLVASGIAKSYGARNLFRNVTIYLRRGERLAIVGPNGSGKSTLLAILRGVVTPDAGSVQWGANTKIACLTQDLQDLDDATTPLEICGAKTRSRTLLGCLKLAPDRLNRPLSELSAGERTKTALARILASGANVLLLDEPTNHLEIEAQEALEQSLRIFPGAVVIASHDRAFLGALEPDLTLTL